MLRTTLRKWARARGAASESGPFDPYKILGVQRTATPEEIKKAYHQLALRFHPDSGKEGNTARFQAVNEAYEAVKSGTWTPPPPDDSHAGGPKYRSYVYEEPGSTSDNYVSKDPQLEQRLKLLLAVCVAIVVVRVWLLVWFPRQRQDSLVTEERVSIHHEEDEMWRKEQQRTDAALGQGTSPNTVFVFNGSDSKM